MGRNLALVGSIGSLGCAVLLAILSRGAIQASWEAEKFGTIVVVLVLLWLAMMQVRAIMGLLNNDPAAADSARASAVTNWIVFMVVMVVMSVFSDPPGFLQPFGSAWGAAWFGNDHLKYGLIPIFFALQWSGAAMMGRASMQDVWGGLAAGAIGFCGVLGVLAIRTIWTGEQTMPSIVLWFFVIGTVLHFVAMWQILGRTESAWLWATMIGGVCLLSGWVLAHMVFKGIDGGGGGDMAAVGLVLYTGWYSVAPYLPIMAYATALWAGLQMRRSGDVPVPAMAG